MYAALGQPRVVKIQPDGVTHAEVMLPPPRPSPFACFPRAAPAAAQLPRVSLSPLDTIMFIRPMQMCAAFFFTSAIDPEALCQSLGRTLSRFPMLSGAVTSKAASRRDWRRRTDPCGSHHRAPGAGPAQEPL